MRKRYLVCYDISSPRRLKKVANTCESFGIRFQLSVFECVLDDTGYEKLKSRLHSQINKELDQVIFVGLGPEEGMSGERYEYVGRPLPAQNRVVVV